MAWIRTNTRTHTKEKPYLINSYFFSKLVRQKKSIGWAKYMYVCVWDMCWRNFCNFPWWLENVKSRSKIALFSNERHFEIWFPKKRTITFFWSKLSKLHKKDPILHVATIFSPKQGEKRTSHGPIPHPLSLHTSSVSIRQGISLKTAKIICFGGWSLQQILKLIVGRGDKLENFDLKFPPLLKCGRGFLQQIKIIIYENKILEPPVQGVRNFCMAP